ncbi:hypothetical protein WJX73_004192 [Symbiochloris irregularis]|uniref:Uncharacterized protein n=1 Tax=Symbiochloris irregularis TaxID=706552 RepID=A0AAW1NWQ5_9CHLO
MPRGVVCRFWLRGQCGKGADCKFDHVQALGPPPASLTPAAYHSKRLLPIDEAGFKAAGVLLCRIIAGKPQVLLGKDSLAGYKLALLGGMREVAEDRAEGSLDTALREFHEETAGQLEPGKSPERGWLAHALSSSLVLWVCGLQSNSKYALYLVDATSDESGVPASVDSVCTRFVSHRTSAAWQRLPHTSREMNELVWVPLDEMWVLAAHVRTMHPFLRAVARFNAYKQTMSPDLQQITLACHGTQLAKSANSIARNGPDFSKVGSANGHAYGRGFYMAHSSTPQMARGYAGNSGAICVCSALVGKQKNQGLSSEDDAGSLLQEGYDSVLRGGLMVLFHPDAVIVTHIIYLGPDDSQEVKVTEQMLQLAADREVADQKRMMELEELRAHLCMVTVFTDAADAYLAQLRGASVDLAEIQSLFHHELTQFERKLPTYARKQDFLKLLHVNQGIVLKGGTGIGKSVTTPQWAWDHHLRSTPGQKPVAVLVPRRAIAEGLSKFVAKERGAVLGGEVGIGIGGAACFSRESKIVFMTYGFFKAISSADEHFSKWGCIILDEAHERKADADGLLPVLGRACAARKELKLVVMSATIEPQVFKDILEANGLAGGCDIIKVPGVTFPVTDVWWTAQPWLPKADGAIESLALETIRIYLLEKTGNVLVFMSTVAEVTALVDKVATQMQHDQQCCVRPMYAKLDADGKEEVTAFGGPQNKGKRLICVSTNVAEAGVTIPGITAVIETGWQMEQQYDPNMRISSIALTRISKASQQQRRGRAGRTAPGKCYTLYSKDVYESDFPEYGTAEVLKSNLDSFLLSMLDNGIDPRHEAELLDGEQIRASLEQSQQHLRKHKAIEEDASSGRISITKKGRMLNSLCMSVELGISILAAHEYGCSAEEELPFAAPSGDMETYLNVYQAWAAAGKSTQWCKANGIKPAMLSDADDLLKKVHRALGKIPMPISGFEGGPSAQRTAAIMRSLAAGFFLQAAVASEPGNPKRPFWLMDGYAVNPTSADLDMGCALRNFTGAEHVIYLQRSMKRDGSPLLMCVSRVEPAWLEEAASFDPRTAEEMRQALQAVDRSTVHIPGSIPEVHQKMQGVILESRRAAVADLSREFPLAHIRRDKMGGLLPSPASHEQQALQGLQAAAPSDNLTTFGRGRAGSLMALARAVLMGSGLWVYGGFLRDYLVRGEDHGSMDLDLGLPVGMGMDPAMGMKEVAKHAVNLGMPFMRNQPGGPKVSTAFFRTADGTAEVEVQVVDTRAFAKEDGRVDFDVNNLKFVQGVGLAVKDQGGAHAQGKDLNAILQNCRRKRLLVLKSPAEVAHRIQKMQQKHWDVTYP